jgi:histidinol phosphatase-like PHP family hydrolase
MIPPRPVAGPGTELLTNAGLAELLAREADKVKPPLTRAFRRASRRAFLWAEEAADLIRSGRSLTELQGIGPYLEKVIKTWLADPPPDLNPPALRQSSLTLTETRSILADNPAWLTGTKGDLQMHSTWSDGEGSISDMAKAAVARNYEYIAITDHAKGLKIAGGIDEQQLEQQATEIETVNRELERAGNNRLRVLRSLELNLNPAGEDDMEEEALAKLDIVIGCFHSSLRREEDETSRYLAALRNFSLQILGHPRGRIYNYRAGLTADWLRVFADAAEWDKAVEIDAYPDRQDLSPDLLTLAKKAGCRISFGTDSHGPSQLRFIEFAAASALRAGIGRERILNFMPRDRLLTWVETVRERAKSAFAG